MAPITWRNVDAPAFGASNNLLSAASNQIGNAGNKILGALTGFEQGQIDKNNQQDALARQQAADSLAASQFQQNFGIAKQRADAGDLGNKITQEANSANQEMALSELQLKKDEFAENTRVAKIALDNAAEDKEYKITLGGAALRIAEAEAIPGNNGAAALVSALDDIKQSALKPQDKAALHSRIATEIGARANTEYDLLNTAPLLKLEAEAAQIAKDRPYDPELSLKNTPITGDVIENILKSRGLTENERWAGLGGRYLYDELIDARKTITDSAGRTVEVPYTVQEIELAMKNAPINENWGEDSGIFRANLTNHLKMAAEMVARNKDNQRQQEAAVAKLKAAQTTFELGKRDNLKETITNLLAK